MNLSEEKNVKISIIGVGGAGNNVVDRMKEMEIPMVEYISVNTDTKALNKTTADTKIQIGIKQTNGLGSGADPENGRISAEENRQEIEESIKGCDMVFVVAGMGGGTGTGAAPVIADIAHKLGILTVAVVTKPFSFEGKKRMDKAIKGIELLKDVADAIVVIPNDNLKTMANAKTTLLKAFELADEVLVQTVKNIVEVIQQNAFVNCDFADICSIIRNSGYMYTTTGKSAGDDRIEEIIFQLKNNKLLETSLENATNVLFCINADANTSLDEIDAISSAIAEEVNENANIIMGMNLNEGIGNEMKVVLMATHKKQN